MPVGQKRLLETKVQRENVMRAAMPELSMTILELATEHGRVSIAEIIKATNALRGTIKKRVTELARAGHLTPVGKGRSIGYAVG